MEFAFSELKWTPDVFWESTPIEIDIGFGGYKKANGLDQETGMTRKKLDEMVEKYG
jgi:hypothetical protein